MNRSASIAAALVSAALILTGCNQSAETATENLIESATGADVDLSDGSVTVTDEEGNVTQLGSQVPLPEGFPTDLPEPAADQIITASSTDGQVIVVWQWNDLTEADVDAYVEQVKAAGYDDVRDSASLGGEGLVTKSVTVVGNGKVVTITGSTVDGMGQLMVNISEDT